MLLLFDINNLFKCFSFHQDQSLHFEIWNDIIDQCYIPQNETVLKKWETAINDALEIMVNIENHGIAELTLVYIIETMLAFIIDNNDSLLPLLLV